MWSGDEDFGKIESKGMVCKVFWARECEVRRERCLQSKGNPSVAHRCME